MNDNTMKLETQVSAKTKVNGVDHKSNVTIDWTGMSVHDLQALAQRSIVIRKQNADRTAGVVPETQYTILATDYRIGARVQKPQKSVEQLLSELPQEELARLLEKYL